MDKLDITLKQLVYCMDYDSILKIEVYDNDGYCIDEHITTSRELEKNKSIEYLLKYYIWSIEHKNDYIYIKL